MADGVAEEEARKLAVKRAVANLKSLSYFSTDKGKVVAYLDFPDIIANNLKTIGFKGNGSQISNPVYGDEDYKFKVSVGTSSGSVVLELDEKAVKKLVDAEVDNSPTLNLIAGIKPSFAQKHEPRRG